MSRPKVYNQDLTESFRVPISEELKEALRQYAFDKKVSGASVLRDSALKVLRREGYISENVNA